MGIYKSLENPSITSTHRLRPSYLSWLQPLDEPPSTKPLCEQDEQEDFRGLGCHKGGRLLTETSIRSWGTMVDRRHGARDLVRPMWVTETSSQSKQLTSRPARGQGKTLNLTVRDSNPNHYLTQTDEPT